MAANKHQIMLGIETSCDDTAVGIVTSDKRILANAVYNQFKEHEIYGGVVPEIAARSHVEHLDTLISTAVDEAKLSLKDIRMKNMEFLIIFRQLFLMILQLHLDM